MPRYFSSELDREHSICCKQEDKYNVDIISMNRRRQVKQV